MRRRFRNIFSRNVNSSEARRLVWRRWTWFRSCSCWQRTAIRKESDARLDPDPAEYPQPESSSENSNQIEKLERKRRNRRAGIRPADPYFPIYELPETAPEGRVSPPSPAVAEANFFPCSSSIAMERGRGVGGPAFVQPISCFLIYESPEILQEGRSLVPSPAEAEEGDRPVEGGSADLEVISARWASRIRIVQRCQDLFRCDEVGESREERGR